ncbi:MAG: hypothetical protein AAGI23_22420 [Bacteroidota bacterium]
MHTENNVFISPLELQEIEYKPNSILYFKGSIENNNAILVGTYLLFGLIAGIISFLLYAKKPLDGSSR